VLHRHLREMVTMRRKRLVVVAVEVSQVELGTRGDGAPRGAVASAGLRVRSGGVGGDRRRGGRG
jgi:hypothetical protein